VVNIVHDEIIIECNREDGDAIVSILSESMLEAAYRYLPDIYVEAEASVAENWSEK
jgi:DNA polymerase I-like protein with 3'-5' exonuclease and polymerase domains